MIKKILFVGVALAIIAGFFLLDRHKAHYPHYERIANQITLDTAALLKENCGVNAIGLGGGMMDNIKSMSLSLQTIRSLSIEEGRELIISCIDVYLDQINSSEKVRPFLNVYPFTENNVRVAIFVDGNDMGSEQVGQLEIISANEGKITYRTFKAKHQFDTALVETYEEAREIVMAGQGPAIAR